MSTPSTEPSSGPSGPSGPPVAAPRPTARTFHGVEVVDEYAWLRDENWQQVMRDPSVLDADVRAHLEAENAWTDAVMAPTKDLQQRLFEEMKGRIKEDDDTVPTPDGQWAYFARYVEGGQYPLVCRRPTAAPDAEPVVLFDGNAEAEGHDYFRLGAVEHTADHRRLAYSLDTNGSEYFTVRIRDLDSLTDLDDVVTDTAGSVAWSADGEVLFYTVLDDNHRPFAVRRHVVGTPQDEDVEVYREDDPGFFVGVGTTQDRSRVVINANDHQTSEAWLVPADDPTAEPRLVAKREVDVEYDLDRHGDRLILRTNADGAEDYKLVTAPLDDPRRENWTDLVPHREGVLVEGFEVLARHLVRLEVEDALPRIVVRDLLDDHEHAIAFDEAAYSLGSSAGYEYDTTTIRYVYSSPTRPSEVWEYDCATRERALLKVTEIPSGHDPSDYVTGRLLATAPDGEQVPVTILHRADLALDGSAPCLLYGYGSYGMSMPAGFSTNALSLVDRGFVYAIAHVRGGKERGYRWYRLGRREHKPNTFTDFIAAAEALVEAGYTSVGGIDAHGGSAGGMLMGAIANLRPDLFNAIIADVPFVDVLNTMLDDTLPLTPPEWPEWGNPIEDPEAFAWIRAYSPYDNVAEQAYPHLWIAGGLTDPRVTYWEPTKWAARVRARRTNDDTHVLLRMEMGAGHGGKSGRFRRLEEVAEKFAFLLLTRDMVDA